MVGVCKSDFFGTAFTKLVSNTAQVNSRSLGNIRPAQITKPRSNLIFESNVTCGHRSGRTVKDTAEYKCLKLSICKIVIVHAVHDSTGLKVKIILRVSYFNCVNVCNFSTVSIEGYCCILVGVAYIIIRGRKCFAVLINGNGFNNVRAAGLNGDRNGRVTCNSLVVVGAVYGEAAACGKRAAGNNSTVVKERLHVNCKGSRAADPVSIALVRNGVNVLVGYACLCRRPCALGQSNGYVKTVGVNLCKECVNIIGRIIVLTKHLNVGEFLVYKTCRRTRVNKLHRNGLGITGLGIGNYEGVRALVKLVCKIAIIEEPICALNNLNAVIINFNSPCCPVTKRLNTYNSSNNVSVVCGKACSLKNVSSKTGQSRLIRLVCIPLVDSNSTVSSGDIAAVLCSISYVTGNCRNSLIPTGEGVLNTISSRLVGRNRTSGSLTVLIGLGFSAATCYPSYCILINSSVELCSISCITCNRNKFLIPTGEGVGVLCSCSLGSCRSHGHFTVVYGGSGGLVTVYPSDGELVDLVNCCDSHILRGHLSGNCSIPSLESMTNSCRISRCSNCSVVILCKSSNYVAVPVHEGDCVLVDCPLCCDSNILSGHLRGNLYIPVCEGITISCRINRFSNISIVFLSDFTNYVAVAINKCDSVVILNNLVFTCLGIIDRLKTVNAPSGNVLSECTAGNFQCYTCINIRVLVSTI